MTSRTSFTARLSLSTPIIQGPMANISTPAMMAAVSNAGALGSLSVGAMDAAGARQAIEQTRALTDRPFNVNVFCHAPAVADAAREQRWLDYLAPEYARFGAAPPARLREIYGTFMTDDAMLEVVLSTRPAVLSLHFGLPDADRIRALREAGIYLLATATSVEEARQIADAGIDAIVAQGIEAGGHRGVFDQDGPDEQLGTLALVRLLATRFDLPVIAAGGIMDGAGIAAALALGAQAAQLGTAFVPCPESSADPAYKQALLSDDIPPTTFTRAISGRTARGLSNRLTALGVAADAPPAPDYPIAYDAGKSLHAAAKAQGSTAYAAQWAGQAAPLSRALPAADLVRKLDDELKATLRGLLA